VPTRHHRFASDKNPEGENPGRGCGAKQTHKAGSEANRRGREKRRGRTVLVLGIQRAICFWLTSRRGKRQPQGRWLRRFGERGRQDRENSVEERSSREDETACESERRTAAGIPVLPVGNDEVMTGVTNPMGHGPVAYNTLKGSPPHERRPGRR